MLDDSDTEWLGVLGLIFDGPIGIALCILALIVAVVVHCNKKDCARLTCPAGQESRLLDHECLCVGKPVETIYLGPAPN